MPQLQEFIELNKSNIDTYVKQTIPQPLSIIYQNY